MEAEFDAFLTGRNSCLPCTLTGMVTRLFLKSFLTGKSAMGTGDPSWSDT